LGLVVVEFPVGADVLEVEQQFGSVAETCAINHFHLSTPRAGAAGLGVSSAALVHTLADLDLDWDFHVGHSCRLVALVGSVFHHSILPSAVAAQAAKLVADIVARGVSNDRGNNRP
jgi:hypothetical protein